MGPTGLSETPISPLMNKVASWMEYTEAPLTPADPLGPLCAWICSPLVASQHSLATLYLTGRWRLRSFGCQDPSTWRSSSSDHEASWGTKSEPLGESCPRFLITSTPPHPSHSLTQSPTSSEQAGLLAEITQHITHHNTSSIMKLSITFVAAAIA